MENKTDESPKTRKKIARTFRWIIGITLCLIFIAWLILWFGKVTEVVVADGLVEPVIKIELRSRVKDTTLSELQCEENEIVKSGQVIVVLNDQGRTKELVDETGIKLAAESVNLERSQRLFEKGLASEKEIEEIKTRCEVLKNQHAAVMLRLEDLTIKAPRDGKLVYLPKKRGEKVDIGELVGLIAGSDELRLRLWVESDDIGNVSAGQKAELLWIGTFYRNLVVGEARIVKIYPYAVERQGKLYFEALADIYKARTPLPFGVKLRARIIGNKEKLLTLILKI